MYECEQPKLDLYKMDSRKDHFMFEMRAKKKKNVCLSNNKKQYVYSYDGKMCVE